MHAMQAWEKGGYHFESGPSLYSGMADTGAALLRSFLLLQLGILHTAASRNALQHSMCVCDCVSHRHLHYNFSSCCMHVVHEGASLD